MDIYTLPAEWFPSAARIFVEQYRRLRVAIPCLPERMTEIDEVLGKLRWLSTRQPILAAVENGRLLGYLGGLIIPHFRETDRTGAFVPEWAHGALEGRKQKVYRALYRAAAEGWSERDCSVHAITLLANDGEGERAWYWSGFGLSVVDAIRPADPLKPQPVTDLTIRQATADDATRLAELEAEHWQHYTQPPVFMSPQQPDDAAGFRDFLNEPGSSAWLALDGDRSAGFLRFQGTGEGSASVMEAEDDFHCTGAYMRPEYRGRRAAPALLDAAIAAYAEHGYTRCSVDFEAFNPEAADFWMRYFSPVCFSLMRIPETITK
jgi:ribosomal protein S18 acetylase RimI-like enzyme